MAAHDILSKNVRVVLLCAEDDEALLATTIQGLQVQGINVEVVSGVVDSPRRVGEVLDATRGEGVFIVVESKRLDRSARLRVEGTFSARRGPGHRLLTTTLGEENEEKLVRRIRATVLECIAGDDAPAAPSRSKKAKARDVVDMRAVETITPLGGIPAQGRRSTKKSAAASADAPPNRDVTDEIDYEDLHPHERGESGGDAAASVSDAATSRAASGGRRWMTYAGLGLAAAIAAGVGVWALNMANDQAASGPVEGERGVPAGMVAPVASAPTDQAEPAEVKEAGSLVAKPSDDVNETPPSTETTDAAVAPALTGEDEDQAIAQAIESGDMRAIDLLLASPESVGSHNWLGAANHCKTAKVNGVGGFHLPTKEELWKLRKARIAPATGSYWSSTLDLSGPDKGENADVALALVDGKIVGTPKQQVGPKALCVRKR